MFMGRERHFYEMPFEGRYIWGITAGIIRGLYERMFDSMTRLVAFDALFFLIPFAVYALWLLITRGSLSNIADWQARTIAWLAAGGAALMIAVLVDLRPSRQRRRPAAPMSRPMSTRTAISSPAISNERTRAR